MQKFITVYLDVDTNDNDLLDSVGNPIEAGWYRYPWPMSPTPIGPFETEEEARTI